MNRTEADLALARDIERALPGTRCLFSDLRRSGAVVGEQAVFLGELLEMFEAAGARLMLRGNEGKALECDGGDPVADAMRVWPEG